MSALAISNVAGDAGGSTSTKRAVVARGGPVLAVLERGRHGGRDEQQRDAEGDADRRQRRGPAGADQRQAGAEAELAQPVRSRGAHRPRAPVADDDLAVGVRGDPRLVGHEDDGDVALRAPRR